MEHKETEIIKIIDNAVSGNQEALVTLLTSIQDIVFNLSLRMLGTVPDAEDATQDILIRIITNLSSFQKKCAFSTWVYKLSSNYLINYKKSIFTHYPLDFDIYGNDIRYANTDDIDHLVDDLCRETMSEELKLSCTNVMLQCLDAENRCIFIFGTMFKLDSRIASEILEITPENYRQKLSRTRKKVANFLASYCGLTGSEICNCKKRVDYAISQKRINPKKTEFLNLKTLNQDTLTAYKEEMEKLDELANTFEELPHYKSPVTSQIVINVLLQSSSFHKIKKYNEDIQ